MTHHGRPAKASGESLEDGYFVTLIRYVAHAVNTEDALRSAVAGAGEIVDVDVQPAGAHTDLAPDRLLTARDIAR